MACTQSPLVSNNPKIPTYYLIFAVTMGDSCGSDDHSSYLLLGEKLSGILASNWNADCGACSWLVIYRTRVFSKVKVILLSVGWVEIFVARTHLTCYSYNVFFVIGEAEWKYLLNSLGLCNSLLLYWAFVDGVQLSNSVLELKLAATSWLQLALYGLVSFFSVNF